MEKNAKRFWRFFGPNLVLFELGVYFLLYHNPLLREVAGLTFFAVNAIIVARLAYIKALVNKHNAKVDAEMAAKLAAQNRLKTPVTAPAKPIAEKRTPAAAEAPSRNQEFVPAPALA